MSEWIYEFHERRDGVTIPTIWVAIALSVIVHVLALGRWLPQVHLPSIDELTPGEKGGSLTVNIAPPPRPPSAPSAPSSVTAAPAPTLKAPAPRVAARPRPAPPPPVMALNKPAPEVPAPPPAVAPPAVPTPPAPAGDLSSYIEAQRRARVASAAAPLFSPSAGRPQPPVEDDAARANRAIATNLSLNRAPTFGPDATKNGGGIFQIKRIGYSDAEFLFYGWNKDIRRNTTQLIEVRKGDAADIRLAVVRKMIVIIREYEQDDFLWESQRLGRNVTLSARQRDNAGLEEFMMREFFPNPR